MSQSADRNATTTTPPKPLVRFSKPIAPAMAHVDLPTIASPAKLRFETAMSQRLNITERCIDKRAYSTPPIRMPAQQAEREIRERVAHLVDQHEREHKPRSVAPQKLHERSDDGLERAAPHASRGLVALWGLAAQQAHGHSR